MFDPLKGVQITPDLILSLGQTTLSPYSQIRPAVSTPRLARRKFALDPKVFQKSTVSTPYFPDQTDADIFEPNLVLPGPKPFLPYRPAASKDVPVLTFSCGASSSCAFIFQDGRYAIYDPQNSAILSNRSPNAVSMVLVNQTTPIFAERDRLSSAKFSDLALANGSKLLPDPLSESTFFFLSSDRKLLSVKLTDTAFQSSLLRDDVDDFDVSSIFLLCVSSQNMSVFSRKDSEPLFRRQIHPNSRCFVDDTFSYEYSRERKGVCVFLRGQPIQIIASVANVFKSSGLVLQYADGALGIASNPPFASKDLMVCPVLLGARLIVWNDWDKAPSVQAVSVVSGEELNGNSEEIAKLKERVLGMISEGADQEMNGRPFLPYRESEKVRMIEVLCRTGCFQAAMTADLFENATLVLEVPPFVELARKNPLRYAPYLALVVLGMTAEGEGSQREVMMSVQRSLGEMFGKVGDNDAVRGRLECLSAAVSVAMCRLRERAP
jgi:hypothetical protein